MTCECDTNKIGILIEQPTLLRNQKTRWHELLQSGKIECSELNGIKDGLAIDQFKTSCLEILCGFDFLQFMCETDCPPWRENEKSCPKCSTDSENPFLEIFGMVFSGLLFEVHLVPTIQVDYRICIM